MKISPVGFGKNNNLYVTSRGGGFTFKLVLFFDNGFAFVVKTTKRREVPRLDLNAIYQNLKESLDKMDFILMTPQQKILNPSMTETIQIRNYIQNNNIG